MEMSRSSPGGRHLIRLGMLALAVCCALGSVGARAASADGGTVSLTVSPTSSEPVGTPITFTATLTDTMPLVYRFDVQPAGGPDQVVRDFSTHNTLTWLPEQEGTYTVTARVKEGFAATTESAARLQYTVLARATGASAVVTALANPLVALYSAPSCQSGIMVVRFRATSETTWTSTNPLICQPPSTRNFVVAGIQANSTYVMQHLVISQDGVAASPLLTYTTGSLPSSLSLPTFTVPVPPAPQSDRTLTELFHSLGVFAPQGPPNPMVTDLSGRLLWYYDPVQAGVGLILPTSLVPGGTVLLLGSDGATMASSQRLTDNVLREIDLAGYTLRETNVDQVNAQLAARQQEKIYAFYREAQRLPNGDTVTLGETMRNVGGTDFVGNMVIVLDRNLQVVWTWDAFDHAQAINNGPTMGPVLGETCALTNPGGRCAVPDPNALDWLHTNAVAWSPTDGNLTISVRHQDWVVKIRYASGQGDGSVIWRLGRNGDFTLEPLSPSDPYPWFSHQHDAHFVDPRTMVLFDNGNTRCTGGSGSFVAGCGSRGQVLTIDEQGRTAEQEVNADVGSLSCALGAAERLTNGNFAFVSGLQPSAGGGPVCHPPAAPFGQSIELCPDGTLAYVQQVNSAEYRSYRVADLYRGTNPFPFD